MRTISVDFLLVIKSKSLMKLCGCGAGGLAEKSRVGLGKLTTNCRPEGPLLRATKCTLNEPR